MAKDEKEPEQEPEEKAPAKAPKEPEPPTPFELQFPGATEGE